MSLAVVGRIVDIEPHPNADRLEVIRVWYDTREADPDTYPGPPSEPLQTLFVKLVTGKHYRAGDLGIWIPEGAIIPGYLAHQEMWLKGRGGATWMPVVGKNMRGIWSPGIWSGQYFRNDRDKPEFCRVCGGRGITVIPGEVDDWDTCPICKNLNPEGWTKWSYWCDWWKVGDDVAGYLGVRYPFPAEIPD